MMEASTIAALTAEELLAAIQFDGAGLAAAIVQDIHTNEVLMIAWMSRASLEQTLTTGEAVFWSRSRQEIWHKGATSGNVQRVVEIRLDCDGDALLLRVKPAGPACHTGAVSCFFRQVTLE
ncbi:MAG: phosphoribosyl-AMP cyclohydrolase [Litorilinea sp.]